MKVLLLSRYGPLGASSRIRSYQYLPYLKSQGIDVTVAPLLNDEYVKRLYSGKAKPLVSILRSYARRLGNILNSRSYDIVWIEKELFPWLPSVVELIMSKAGIPYIVDYDDAIFHRYDLNQNGFVRALLGRKVGRIMQRAEFVMAGNRYLADYAIRTGAKRVECIPTVVDLGRYHMKENSDTGEFKIGWIGSPVTVHYINNIMPVVAQFLQEGKSSLYLVGVGHIDLHELPLKVFPWSENTETSHIQDFDVGIMPLSDNPWERGKCGYKLIQYMACGKPVIASPVGANTEIVEHGVNGFLSRSKEEWLAALTILRDDPFLRRKMGAAGRQKVEDRYCLQKTAPKLVSLIKSV